ncbi:putative metallo-hydrolase [Pseudomonas sp. THAF187a]|uniref:MBL fold metallo-hydrolase n=1 Tax=Pseudomonadaceae TaxID=135621 RepID=UPI0012690A11|nr:MULTISPECIES: MBL fold metallo-hydrolase [unclassified Pseudomonas]QFT22051.1 putative metallo-hydrolase [Pseudomonas sp. THAF187a]QFT42238.1 putative metallo-hydrolase [Pseudomonas sp. THAF42]TNF13712.1 MAG: MBL fold metallo-hydrolase [Pseudomonadales bacterium]|tara:strand:- start:1434 stop:2297 length:864 start_codon:yes stop_codon:yes gene_type:complete
MQPDVVEFFDPATYTYSYVVIDPASQHCAIIDSVLDYDAASGRTSHASAERIVAFVRARDLHVEWLLETHVHADHLSAAPFLKRELGGQLAIGENIRVVQNTFGKLFNAGSEFATDGSQFDRLLRDGDEFRIGELRGRALHTPGHTPACMTYLIGDAGFVGDTLFMPDYGTARCDFPGGDAHVLFQSIQKLFALPDDTRLFMCHDYKAPGRDDFRNQTTVAEQRAHNVHVHQGIAEADFVAMRRERDATLGMPNLILPSVQVNMRAGQLPPAEGNGTRYLKIPLDVL